MIEGAEESSSANFLYYLNEFSTFQDPQSEYAIQMIFFHHKVLLILIPVMFLI